MPGVTSGTLATIASELTALGDALEERVADFDQVISSTRTALDLLEQSWRGPLPDQMNGEVSTYVEAVATVVDATESARGTVDGWATAATAASERLAGLERSLATTDALIAAGADGDNELLGEDRRRISTAISNAIGEWAQTCSAKGAELDSAIATLQQCSLVEVGSVDQRSALLSDAYSTGLAAWAVQHDMELSTLDPSGALDQEADERLAEFADSEYAGLLYAVIETMNQADITTMNGKSSKDDWLLSTDPDVVRFRLEIAANLAGIELTEDQLDALTAQIVTAAIWGAATDNDGRGTVDDQFDENADIEAALDERSQYVILDGEALEELPLHLQTERDVEFGDDPSAADEYVQAWLEAQWEGDPGVFDYARMILVPDFEVMNPWSDEFHLGWAIVEIAGIVPWTKAGKLISLARLGRHGDEMAEAVELFDEGAEILSDSGRVTSEVAGSGDEVLAAGDEVVESGDEVVESGDEITAAGDEVATNRLPRTDPEVLAEIGEVRGPALERLQTEIDRIWAETQEALPGASPQQLGTRAHRELEAWIRDHADELVDPDTGYRVQAEISFVEGGGPATRGTAGSIRPDVIIERRVEDAFGNSSWEVVEVADLKTGRAGISTSWQTNVDEWLDPVKTTELRPSSTAPVPVPE